MAARLGLTIRDRDDGAACGVRTTAPVGLIA